MARSAENPDRSTAGPSMIDWVYGLQHFGIKLGLDNIRRLLELLRHPERTMTTVLVGGTNGKGSVAAMLHSVQAELRAWCPSRVRRA